MASETIGNELQMLSRLKRYFGAGDNLRSQLLRGTLGSVTVKAAYLLVQFSVGVFLARMMNPKALGTYALTIALVQLSVVLVQLGLPAFLVRAIAVARVENRYSEIKGLIIGGWQIVLSSSVILAIGGCLWLWLARPFSSATPSLAFLIGIFLVPLLAISATGSGVIRGLGNVILGQIPDETARPLLFLATLTGIYLTGVALTPERALMAYGAAAAASVAVTALIVLHLMPHSVRKASPHIHRLGWLRQSLPYLLLAGAQILNYQVDVLMLGFLRASEEVGHYRVAIQVADGLGVVLLALSIVIGPQIAKLSAQNDWTSLQQLIQYSHRIGAALLFPLGLAVAAFSSTVLVVAFGDVYKPAADALAILAISKIAYATVGFSGLALSMLGKAGVATVITLISVFLNIIMNLTLIPVYGIEGAALATGVSQVVAAGLGVVYIRLVLKLRISIISKGY